MMTQTSPTHVKKNIDFLINSEQNQKGDEKGTIQSRKKYWEDNANMEMKKRGSVEIITRSNSTNSEDEPIPEIKDIYDQIYGNVQSKLVFYENKQEKIQNGQKNVSNNKGTAVIDDLKKNTTKLDELINKDLLTTPNATEITITEELQNEGLNMNTPPIIISKNIPISDNTNAQEPEQNKISEKPLKIDIPQTETFSDKNNLTTPQEAEDSSAFPTPVNSPTFDKRHSENLQSNPDLLNGCELACSKCQKAEFINDRSEVLTEINANLKLELESVKQNLKKEVAKNNELNFEIANIEVTLETYYKEAKNQKSTLGSIYSAMKSYVSDPKNDFQESYTFKRIKMIADYMESLKNKLEHQDRIIKSNFIENPYYTDLITKHEAVLRQLDDISRENEELKGEIKKKAIEELDIIKELNRQKFQIESKCKEMENYYRNEIVTKETQIRSIEEEYKKQFEDCQVVLDQKDEEMAKMHTTFMARINNYKQELLIVYRKWKEQKMLNNLQK